MNFSDFQRLERQLHTTYTRNTQLAYQNEEQRKEILSLRQRVSYLQNMLQSQPFHMVTQQLDPISIKNSLVALEDKLARSSFENAFLRSSLNSKDIAIAQANSRAAHFEAQIENQNIQTEQLRYEIRNFSLRLDAQRRESQRLKVKIERINKQREQSLLIHQKLTRQLKQEQDKNQNILLPVKNYLQSLTTQIQEKYLLTKENSYRDIVDFQKQDIAQKNQEIKYLKELNGHKNQNDEVLNLKNTIKHLRGQISRFSGLIELTTNKLAQAETSIHRYSELGKKFQSQTILLDSLNEQIQQLSQSKQQLQQLLIERKEEFQREKLQKISLKKTLIEIVQENQALHSLLSEVYGNQFKNLINHERMKLEKKLNLRAQDQKWTTIEQLISVNERLKLRLKIS